MASVIVVLIDMIDGFLRNSPNIHIQ